MNSNLKEAIASGLGLPPGLADLLTTTLAMGLATALGLLLHRVLMVVLSRLSARTSSQTDDLIIKRITVPLWRGCISY